jgi:hypothetical protein
MASKEKDQFTVRCEGLWLNDTKPAEWKQSFPWKPSVSFHFIRVDENFESLEHKGEETQKKYLKDLWLFQAMGGKNAKGHFFELMAESGTVPAKDGEPEKPYTTVMPIAEMFTDGTSRFIKPPKDGKIEEPVGKKTPPPVTKPPVGAKTTPTPARPNGNGSKMPKGAEGFLEKALTPQTDAWWALKEAFNLDGAIISNSFQYAATFLQNFQGDDAKCQDAILRWAGWFETTMREEKAERSRTRLTMLLGLAVNRAQVTDLVTKGWGMLPKSHYEIFREVALARLEQLPKTGNGEPQSASPVPESEPEEASVEKETEEEIPF